MDLIKNLDLNKESFLIYYTDDQFDNDEDIKGEDDDKD